MNNHSNDRWAKFLDRLVHDLREPLRGINAYAQLLTEIASERQAAEGETAIKEILASAARMRTLIDGLSGYSVALREKADTAGNSGSSLQLAFDIVTAAMADQIRGAGATVTGTDLPKVALSLERSMQLLENLVGNALRFRGEAPPIIRVTAKAEAGNLWAIQVEDNGIGIPPEDREAVFEPFMRVDGRKHLGAGLGLTICRTIVEAHGGTIRIESTPGRGSICSFILPDA
jgi:signal transduction histidine kinase